MSLLDPDLFDPEFLAHVAATASPEDRARYLPLLGQTLKEQQKFAARAELERDWRPLIRTVFPSFVRSEFAEFHEQIWDWFFALELGVAPECGLVADIFRGGAKALAVDTPIPTPTGWTTMGSITPGDVIYDHAGMPTTVTDVSPVEIKNAYRVTFNDGSSIDASGDHLWSVLDIAARRSMTRYFGGLNSDWPAYESPGVRSQCCVVEGCEYGGGRGKYCSAHAKRARQYGDPLGGPLMRTRRATTPKFIEQKPGSFRQARAKVLTTQELLAQDILVKTGQYYEKQWAIPNCEPIECADVNLPIAPYLLGYWLGDGHSASGVITVGRCDVQAVVPLLVDQGYDLKVHQRTHAFSVQMYGLLPDLRTLGVLNNKHVPALYLRAKTEDRLAVLQGLLDSDGTVHHSAASIFGSTKQVLAEGVYELAVSLGLRATVTETRAILNGKDCGPSWLVRIPNAGLALHRLPRKRDLAAERSAKSMTLTNRMRLITGIEKLPDQPVRCIVVDSPHSLFLAGKAMLPTHNSSSAEMGTVMAGATRRRRYALYVCDQQDRGDDHVNNIGFLLESPEVEKHYPEVADRMVGKFGNSKGWRRNRLRCANGFTVDAVGLDTARRGVKIEDMRPDLIIFDDIDQSTDSPRMVAKKIELMTGSIIPAGDPQSVAVAFFQNTIHANSVMAKVLKNEADFLRKRVQIGPVPGFENFEYEEQPDRSYKIIGGIPNWKGFGVDRAEKLLNLIGPRKFKSEVQHDVDKVEGAFWSSAQLDAVRVAVKSVPDLTRVVVAIDPSGGDGEGNDEQGIIVVGLGVDGKAYVLGDLSCKLKPHSWAERALYAYDAYDADVILGEKNYGGDMVESTVRSADERRRRDQSEPDPAVNIEVITATKGKVWRAEPVADKFGDPERPDTWANSEVLLAGSFPEMEEELRTWYEGCGWSPNRADAMWMAIHELLLKKKNSGGFFFA